MFTKGKWSAYGTSVLIEQYGLPSHMRICKAQTALSHEDKIPKAEAEANARLIAAAPEMYDCLIRLVHSSNYLSEVEDIRFLASEVVSKIKGRK